MRRCRRGTHTYDGAQCKECQRTAIKRWLSANPERVRASQRVRSRRWRQRNPLKHVEQQHRRRARVRACESVPFTRDEWLLKVQRYNGLCAYCGCRPWSEMDHVVPIAVGGRHAIDNVVPACAGCNRSKGATVWLPDVRMEA